MTTHFQDLVIDQDQPVVDGIAAIERSSAQIALVTDKKGVLVGILTNGDVRRSLVLGLQTDVPVRECMNREFKAVRQGSSREELVKLFDLGYSAVPLVDEQRRLVDFATPDYLRPAKESPVLARACAPVWISLSDGGADLTQSSQPRHGAVLNTSLALYAHATLIPTDTPAINLYMEDLDRHEHYENLRGLLDSPDKSLLCSVVSVLRPAFGFDLFVHCDFPADSGFGGSSAIATSVVASFSELRLDSWTTYEIAEIAFHAQRACFNLPATWQDQYASALGGFNLVEFDQEKSTVHSIRLQPEVSDELQECLLLCDTAIKFPADNRQPAGGSRAWSDAHTELSKRMHRHLLRGELTEFGFCMHDGWLATERLAGGAGYADISAIYETARANGALGGQLLGVGKGSSFLFFVQPRSRAAVARSLRKTGCELRSVRFESEGVRSWRTKVA